MRPLLQKGIKLIIVSGTTIENIAGGKIESYFAEEELKNLYLGLGRGAYNYSFKDGIPYIFKNMVPDKGEILKIHQICFEIHQTLKEKYDFDTDIVFSLSLIHIFQFIDNSNYDTVVDTQLSAEEGPDIICESPASALKHAKLGYLEKVNDLGKKYSDAGTNVYSYDGDVYALPGISWFEGTYFKDVYKRQDQRRYETGTWRDRAGSYRICRGKCEEIYGR